MGTSVRSSPSIVVRELQVKPPKSQWLSLVLRRRRLMPSTSPLTSTTSRETARLMPSTPATSSVPATSTQPWRPSRRSEVDVARERSSWPSPMSSPCTRPARTPRTKEAAKNLMKELCDPADDDGFIPFKPFLEKMCAAEKNASHFLSLASTKSLHRRTSTFFGATDEPSRTIQEIAGFIEIHSRDRGQKIACLVYLERKWWGGR